MFQLSGVHYMQRGLLVNRPAFGLNQGYRLQAQCLLNPERAGGWRFQGFGVGIAMGEETG